MAPNNSSDELDLRYRFIHISLTRSIIIINTVPIVSGYCKLNKCQSTSGGPANELQRLMLAHHHGSSVQELRIEIKSAPA